VQVQKGKIWRRILGVILRNKVRSCEIRKTLNVEPLLGVDRSQLP